jgi:hypothetical protein
MIYLLSNKVTSGFSEAAFITGGMTNGILSNKAISGFSEAVFITGGMTNGILTILWKREYKRVLQVYIEYLSKFVQLNW